MSDLDEALAAMMRERSTDISSLPPQFDHLIDGGNVEVLDTHRYRKAGRPAPRHRTAWSVAGAVAAVVALVGFVTVAAHHQPSVSDPPGYSPSPTAVSPSPVTTSPTVIYGPSPHATRDVSLDRFGMKSLPGYAQHEFNSMVGYRWLAVRAKDDSGVPIGCNGCESASDYIYVIDKGHFDEQSYGIASMGRTQVAGVDGYLGLMREYGSKGGPRVPTVAWQFAPDRWVLVQGVTPDGEAESALLKVASAVEPTVSVPLTVPFTMAYVPDLPITSVMDDRSEGYAYVISFGISGREFDITVWDQQDVNTGPHNATTRRLIGGLTGYYDVPGGGADIAIHSGEVEFGIAEASTHLTPEDITDMNRVVDGIRFTNGDGSQPYANLDSAIP